jgi:hypothetical protein
MCREGVDLTTLKVSLKHEADRIRLAQDHLRQWAALAANVNLENVSGKLQEGYRNLAAAEELLKAAVAELVERQMGGGPEGSGVTVTQV